MSLDADAAPDSPRFDVGDRVLNSHALGGFFRPRVPRHTHGIVIARAPRGELEVRFANGRTELLNPTRLEPA